MGVKGTYKYKEYIRKTPEQKLASCFFQNTIDKARKSGIGKECMPKKGNNTWQTQEDNARKEITQDNAVYITQERIYEKPGKKSDPVMITHTGPIGGGGLAPPRRHLKAGLNPT